MAVAPSAKDAGNAVVESTMPQPSFQEVLGRVQTSTALRQFADGLADNYRHPKNAGNAAWDARSRQRHGAGGVGQYANLYRGYMVQLREETYLIKGSGGKKRRRVDFQYNPTQISLNYSINTDVFPSESNSIDDTAPILATSGQTLSWTLYFNRTYEMLNDPNGKKVGVMSDIQSLEYLLGSKGDGEGMAATPIMVCFGRTKTGKILAFGGWISDLNVEFLQFTNRMIPTVAMVQVGMVRKFISDFTTPVAPGVPGSGNPETQTFTVSGSGGTTTRSAGPGGRPIDPRDPLNLPGTKVG